MADKQTYNDDDHGPAESEVRIDIEDPGPTESEVRIDIEDERPLVDEHRAKIEEETLAYTELSYDTDDDETPEVEEKEQIKNKIGDEREEEKKNDGKEDEKGGVTVKDAWSSSCYGSKESYGPQFAWEGGSDTYEGGFFHSSKEKDPWLMIELDSLTTITAVIVVNRKDGCGERLKNLEIRAGEENDLSNPVVGEFKGPGQTGGTHQITLKGPTKARFISFQLKMDEGILQINGIKLKTESDDLYYPYHIHPLKILQDADFTTWFCDGRCRKRYEIPDQYPHECQECNFTVCNDCMNCEEIRSLHHEHPLTIPDDFRDCYCDICMRHCREVDGGPYTCFDCDFDLCQRCMNEDQMSDSEDSEEKWGAPEIKLWRTGEPLPQGFRLINKEELMEHKAAAKRLMGAWTVAKIYGRMKFMGYGYGKDEPEPYNENEPLEELIIKEGVVIEVVKGTGPFQMGFRLIKTNELFEHYKYAEHVMKGKKSALLDDDKIIFTQNEDRNGYTFKIRADDETIEERIIIKAEGDDEANEQSNETKKATEEPKKELSFENQLEKWRKVKDALMKKVRTYGNIDFTGQMKKERVKFIRLSKDADGMDVYRYMTEIWELQTPSLIVSVTGGSRNLERKKVDVKFTQQLKETIHQIANIPGTWFITNGTHNGTVQLVTDALRNTPSVCLGIAGWNSLTKKEKLEESVDGQTVKYGIPSWKGSGCSLNCDHTHFILVDNNEKIENNGDNSWEGQNLAHINFRSKFETYMTTEFNVPTMLLVVGGRRGTFNTIYESIKRSKKTPVVLVKGSGNVVDLLCNNIMKKPPNKDAESRRAKLMRQISGNIDINDCKYLLPDIMTGLGIDEKETEECKNGYAKKMVHCMRNKQMFRTVTIGPGSDTTTAVLKELLKGGKIFDKVRHAFLWEQPSLAKEIISENFDEVEESSLDQLLMMALARGSVKSARHLLFDYGATLSNDQLETLYAYQSYESNFPYPLNEQHEKTLPEYLEEAVDDIKGESYIELQKIIVQVYNWPVMARKRWFLEKEHVTTQLRSVAEEFGEIDMIDMIFPNQEDADTSMEYDDDVYWELFIWAVLCNLPDMACFLWPLGEDQIAKALIAANVFDVLAKNRKSDSTKSYQKSSRIFQNMAYGLLDHCYQTDPELTVRLITTSISKLPERTCVDFALNYDDFVTHPALQDVFTNVWTGKLHKTEVNMHDYPKILLAYLCPPLIGFLFEFSKKKDNENEIDAGSAEIEEAVVDSGESTEKEENAAGDDLRTDDEISNGGDITEMEEINAKENGGTDKEQLVPNGAESEKQNIRIEIKGKNKVESSAKIKSACTEFFREMKWFYWETPVVGFVLDLVFMIIFLVMYALANINHHHIGADSLTGLEIILVSFVSASLLAEGYQISQYEEKTVSAKLMKWISETYNQADLLNSLIFFSALGLRFHESTQQVAHTLHSINCGMWIIRILADLNVSSTFGPYLDMIKHMTKDLLRFLLIFFIFALAYGVVSTSLLYPQANHLTKFITLFLRPVYHVYGEYFIDLVDEGSNDTYFGTPRINQYDEYVVWVSQGIYLVFTIILLLNIIIAVFNNTYADIQQKADKVWKIRRYYLIDEYSKRVPIPPPFSIIPYFFLCIRRMIFFCCDHCNCGTQKIRERIEKEKRRAKKSKYGNKKEDKEKLEDLNYLEGTCASQVYMKWTKNNTVPIVIESNGKLREHIVLCQDENVEAVERRNVTTPPSEVRNKSESTQETKTTLAESQVEDDRMSKLIEEMLKKHLPTVLKEYQNTSKVSEKVPVKSIQE